MQQVGRGAVQHAVDCPQQGREGLVKEADDDAGRRQCCRIHFVPTPADRQTDIQAAMRQTDATTGSSKAAVVQGHEGLTGCL